MTGTSETARAFRGPAVFSWGFRPFFLAAALWGVVAMLLWLPVFEGHLQLPTAFSPVDWHVHEMLFGFAPAVIGGFLLTAIPNWTGRLPVVGAPLAGLVGLWAAGRIAVAGSALWGPAAAGVVDVAFLVTMAAVAAREVHAAGNLRNLPVVAMVLVLGLANGAFHAEAAITGTASVATRAGFSVVLMLIGLIGGRIVPSFTQNWLARNGKATIKPAPFGRFDKAAMAVMGLGLLAWTVRPEGLFTAAALAAAAAASAARLARWKGFHTVPDRLVLVLHVGYGFLPVGFLLAALHAAAPGTVSSAAGFHAFGIGAIGTMTLAVMTRASLGHTGRPLVASRATQALYAAIVGAAAARVAMAFAPDGFVLMHVAALGWIVAFGTFLGAYGPLLGRRRPATA
ncbi:NnrS family protein [Prosthecomicrobium sp. N25]|uniref:NnrS family protein n=1 Tax=Prosthecomicrobium sp. N25 TaxID=3129254 RepID=UPI0030783140